MELIFLILVIWAIVAIVSEFSAKNLAKKPADFGDRLRSLAKSGKQVQVRALLTELPDWPIRGLLVSVASSLGELRRGAALALPAGVPTQTTQLIVQLVEQNERHVWSIAIRVASLAQQSNVNNFDGLPGEAIQWLNQDMHALTGINQAAYDTSQSLTVAIAKGSDTPGGRNDMGVELHALGVAMRKLSGPSRGG